MLPTTRIRSFFLLFVALLGIPLAAPRAMAEDTAASVEFFELKIRPALVEHCLDCHASDTEASGGLLLDSKEGWLAGGDSGTSIVPGKSGESRLFRAMSYDDQHLQMPPDGRLPPEVLADFKQWIDAGALDPRSATPLAQQKRQTGLPVERAEEHWSYRPITEPSVEPDPQSGSAIDSFVKAKLQQAGIAPAPQAAREVLARRLCFDLTGLPPTPEQLRSFLEDSSEAAYQRFVEQLLASPQYGETFARHWMDVVRYADSITLRGFVLPQAWRYRDYLTEAYSTDRSFALMIEEQIAGDLMHASDPQERARQLVATSFWALGNTNLEQQDKSQLEMDYIDEQLEVMGRAFLGQTIGCARCHDHKFDPIPTKDYYALAGILRSTSGLEHENVSKWIERPLPLAPEQEQVFAALERERQAVMTEIAELKKRLNVAASQDKRLIPIAELPGVVVDSGMAKLVGEWVTSSSVGPIIGDSYIHDNNANKGEKSATLEPRDLPPGEYQVRLAYSPGTNRTRKLAVTVFSADGEKTVTVNQQLRAPEEGVWVNLGSYRFEQDGQAYVLISNADTDGHVIIDAVQFLPAQGSGTAAPKAQPDAPAAEPAAEEKVAAAAKLEALEARRKGLEQQLAQRPHYLTVVESNPPRDIPIHVRGDVHNLGEVVPRGFLTALKHSSPRLQSEAEGRRELAAWVRADDNPLTARVYANRVWTWLMGQGLVSTVDNFGTTGTAPSHPELLDWLALRLVQSGWSTKELVREIVTSQAYRRAIVEASPVANEVDPDNRLMWRGHARRVRVEALRDAMLLISGELDLTVGGSLIPGNVKADYNYQHSATRRSIYQPVFRNSLPELFEAFDFANTSVSTGQRPRSTVATQALVLMNHPWVTERAAQAAKRFADLAEPDSAEQSNAQLIEALCMHCFGRAPTAAERQICDAFMGAGSPGDPAQRTEQLQQLIQALFASLDFRFLE